ncbi:MAG: thrombospondin type 3 repeat-containing protein, partial [Planctomycetota bacterium]
MNHEYRHLVISLIAAAAMLVLTGTAAAGDAHWWARNGTAKPKPPVSTQDPGNYQGPGASPWQSGSTPAPLNMNANRWLFIGIENDDDNGTAKDVIVEIECDTGVGVDLRRFELSKSSKNKPTAGGYPANTSARGFAGSVKKLSSSATKLRLQLSFAKCPEWEYVTLFNSGQNRSYQNFRISVGTDECEDAARAGSEVSGDTRPSCGCTTTGVEFTEFHYFPETAMVDMGVPPFFSTTAGPGGWIGEFVFQTPEGDPRPLGGVRWSTDGPGVTAGEFYSFSFAMLGDADARYEVFAFDQATGEHTSYVRDMRPRLGAWVSRHSTSGSLAMSLHPQARGHDALDAGPEERLLPSVEPRLGGIETIEVELNRPVVLVDPLAVSVKDTTAAYVPDLVSVENGGLSLVLEFAPGALPNQRAYEIDIAGAIADAYNGIDEIVGDTDTVLIALEGDVTGDGKVSDEDVSLINLHLGEPVSPDTAALDLDLDGIIAAPDADAAQARLGDSVLCPGSFPTVPWYEDFDDYDPGSSLHGGCGWKGWDDDPAFDAPVTDEQAQSGSQSLRIDGDADLVHEFDGPDTGQHSFSGWVYIPTDFESAGGGPLDGSYFMLLNTYNDSGPYNWSVQAQFDSNDGMLKVYYGNGMDTVDVPYETDRWVKIQSIIDLDEDWTRVYFDDDLVAEYTWTGGVTGVGGGVLDIAAVDLYAFGSTSLYYDDLKLEPIEGCGSGLLSDADADGSSLLDEFLRGTDSCTEDTDGDGALDGVDNCPTTFNPGQEDANGNGIGDACEDVESCPEDLDGSGDVGFGDSLQ